VIVPPSDPVMVFWSTAMEPLTVLTGVHPGCSVVVVVAGTVVVVVVGPVTLGGGVFEDGEPWEQPASEVPSRTLVTTRVHTVVMAWHR